MEFCRERDAISNLLNISRLGNQLMQAEKPWKLVKSTSKEDKVTGVLL
jgi:methionyl-tRNA synthetase